MMRNEISRQAAGAAILAATVLTPATGRADLAGVGFWLPGMMGSLAAVPGQPGWSMTNIYLHYELVAGSGKQLQQNASVVTGLYARADAVAFMPAYTFETPVLGGQLTLAALGVPGHVGVGVNATLTGPFGNQISGAVNDSRTTWADVYYLGTLKWNHGVDNYMVYLMGNIPSGTYDSTRLANLSAGHVAVDAGAGYTYLNPETGREFSVVGGFTYNAINSALQYQNGIDFHLDWGMSQFIGKSVHAGFVGYAYQQLTGDSGAGARLGDFKGSAVGVGPQIGFMFAAGQGYQGYLNLRGYWDVFTENRAKSSTVMMTLSFAPATPQPVTPRGPRHVKAP
ncbi:hypothetical protein GGD66_001383 [Bradyrhizobium sp. CIR48]|uniref:SphA family protein n=1 Tax=Bradyrhizobium sp. CIR48 TaxID=2663840 RepID=UPI001814BFB4|nr:transporter [Bradyrhizobium sp. CIR48]MBB4422843.1 hypothetical protein [Bradyrhizobium sp. CIR48]